MNRREKILAIAAASVVVLFVGYGVVSKLLLGPLRECDTRSADLQRKIDDLKLANARGKTFQQALRGLARHTFVGDEPQVREQVRARLSALKDLAGLSTEGFSSQSLAGTRIKVAGKASKATDRTVGQSISIRGQPSEVINLLYLISKDPYIHRLEDVDISPDPRTGKMNLQLKYFTLLLDPKHQPYEPNEAQQHEATHPRGVLDTPLRSQYDMIVQRDVFRPYRKRIVRVEPPPQSPPSQPPPQQPTPPPYTPPPANPEESLRVTGLTTFGDPQVSVSDARTREVTIYQVGQKVLNATIAMVDYRPMPHPEDRDRISPSRLILRIGENYWAVEIGQTLSQKHRMRSSDLPEELRSSDGAESGSSSASAGGPNT